MAGSITTGINFDTYTLSKTDEIVQELGMSRSQYVQIAVREKNKKYRKQSVNELIESLHEDELKVLKDIIKKGAV